MVIGKQIFFTLLGACAFWVGIIGCIILFSHVLFEAPHHSILYNRTSAKSESDTGQVSAQSHIASMAHGAIVFQQCAVCHRLNSNATSAIGPNLSNIIGRKIAAVKTFYYSQSMQDFAAAHKLWTPTLLDSYLANPKALVPGNRMAYYGLRNAKDRADLLLYLYQATNLP